LKTLMRNQESISRTIKRNSSFCKKTKE
jgi:hypothetical protein